MFDIATPRPLTTVAVGLVASALLWGAGLSGCAQSQKKKIEDPQDLRQRVSNFHRFLRWEEFARASKVIAPEFRHTFLGRYEEYGDDLDIVHLEVEKVDEHDPTRRRVEVEQRWFVKPDMTVDDDEFVEIWRKTDDGWMLEDRMEKQEWERRQQSADSES